MVIEGTTADAFEGNFTFADPTADWTWAWGAAGDLVGAGSLSIDNLKLDGNTISTTNANGNLVLSPNGTGGVTIPAGSSSVNGIHFSGDPNAGLAQTVGADWVSLYAGGLEVARWSPNGFYPMLELNGNYGNFGAAEGAYIGAFRSYVEANTAGSGSPNILAYSESMKILTNQGATALNYHTLPGALNGPKYTFCVQDSDGLRVTASSGDTIRSVASVTSSGGYIESTTVGSCVVLEAINTTEWLATSISGTWSFN